MIAERVVREHYDRLYRLAVVMSGNGADAADLTQETVATALERWGTFRGDAQPSTWLIGILRNKFRESARRRRPPASRPTAADPAPDLDPLRAAIPSLPEPQRTALYLFYYEQMDYATIARTLEIPIGTVRSRLHEARAALRAKLEATHDV